MVRPKSKSLRLQGVSRLLLLSRRSRSKQQAAGRQAGFFDVDEADQARGARTPARTALELLEEHAHTSLRPQRDWASPWVPPGKREGRDRETMRAAAR